MEPDTYTVQAHLGLVRALVPRFLGRGVEYDDLFQAGCLGLTKAVRRFDPTLGYSFSTYAVPVILGEMKRLFREGGAVKISRSLQSLYKRAQQLLNEGNGDRPLTVSQLAEQLQISPETCAAVLGVARQPISLNDPESGAETDIPVPGREEEITDRLSVQQMIQALPEAEQRLIQYRYYQNKTQTETAARLGISQVQVSRREKRILEKLRGGLL